MWMTLAFLNKRFFQNKRLAGLVYTVFAIAVITQTVVTSWVDEDAFITFRVVDNFIQGFGLRWNVVERVQAYTNPLWMLLHIPVYAITDNIVVTTSFLGWVCLLGSLYLGQLSLGRDLLRNTALFLCPLLITTTNAAYFTSGLEGPLLNVLFAGFAWVVVCRPKRFWFWLSMMTALSMLTRLDAIILYAPMWGVVLRSQWKNHPWKEVFWGWAPLLAWLLFSLFYYGFLLPNTAPAKLGGHLPQSDYLRSGVAYAYDFLLADPWTAAAIVIALLYLPWLAWRRRDPDTIAAAALAMGIALYCAYIVWIGGAQLSSRMFSLPAFAVTWLWAWRFPFSQIKVYLAVVGAMWITQHWLAYSPEERHAVPCIAQAQIGGVPWAHHMWVRDGAWWQYRLNPPDVAQKPDHAPRDFHVMVTNVIGNYGFYTGPYEVIIDPVALSDPLLARLPAASAHLEKVGDVTRIIPPGYDRAILGGDMTGFPPPLAEYYQKIQVITRGDLWDMERLKTIILFHLGAYDDSLNAYIRDDYPRKID